MESLSSNESELGQEICLDSVHDGKELDEEVCLKTRVSEESVVAKGGREFDEAPRRYAVTLTAEVSSILALNGSPDGVKSLSASCDPVSIKRAGGAPKESNSSLSVDLIVAGCCFKF
jgi:hypothetical protein